MMTLNELLQKYGEKRVSTLTKYPSILTYHNFSDTGIGLAPSLVENKLFPAEEDCFVTEKIDGANSRIIVFNHDYIIGSRDLFLYAKGDRYGDPALNIVNTIKNCADKMVEILEQQDEFLYVIYGETYGGSINSSKNYTIDKTYSYCMFDIAALPLTTAETILNYGIESLLSWREYKNTHWKTTDELKKLADECQTNIVPYLEVMKGKDMPITLKDTYNWLKQYYDTRAGINNIGKSEGVVARTGNRSLIRKIRFNDYEKTAEIME